MFVVVVATVVLLIVIALIMVTSGTKTDASQYTAEAAKVLDLISRMKSESKFYYAAHDESYSGISVDYFRKYHFAEGRVKEGDTMVACSDTVTTDCWEGFPPSADNIESPYTGPYIEVGGTAGDKMRIIVGSLNGGRSAGIYVIKYKPNDIPEQYTYILEKTLQRDPTYFGG